MAYRGDSKTPLRRRRLDSMWHTERLPGGAADTAYQVTGSRTPIGSCCVTEPVAAGCAGGDFLTRLSS